MGKEQTVLILGATGGIGGELMKLFAERGWGIRALNRNPSRKKPSSGAANVTWIKGDSMSASDVRKAAAGASVIVHAVNPPGYRNWAKLVLPMIDNTIAAARTEGALIVLPGTVYNYGPDAFPDVAETAPQNPRTRKGRIRVELERRLRKASTQGARVLIVRAGDFFGPRAGGSWFSQGMITPGRPIKGMSYPGKPGIGHQWAYLPDVARTMLTLVERRGELEPFATFHMDGHWDADGTAMVAAIGRAIGNPNLKARPLPWTLLRLISPFNATLKEMMELRYLWQTPLRLNNAKLKAFLGAEPHTPLDRAVRDTLVGLGCISASGGGAP